MKGAVAEAAFSNLFAIDAGKRLLTPPLTEGILGGITRDLVLAIGRELGFATEETRILPEDLLRAREVFLTASVMEIMPVVRIEGKRIGEGGVGEGTRALLDAYRERVTAATEYGYGDERGS